jgi:hypothetical protein
MTASADPHQQKTVYAWETPFQAMRDWYDQKPELFNTNRLVGHKQEVCTQSQNSYI